LPPIVFTAEEIKEIRASLPELPWQKKERFIKEYGLALPNAKTLVEDKEVADYFEKVMMEMRAWVEALEETEGTSEEIWEQHKAKLTKLVCGWLLSELFKLINETGQSILDVKITPENFAEFITIVYKKKVNSSAAQVLLKEMYETGGDPSQILEEKDLSQVGDTDELSQVVEQIIKNNPGQVREYQAGKEPLIKFFIGLAMRQTKGKADPEMLENLFKEKLKS